MAYAVVITYQWFGPTRLADFIRMHAYATESQANMLVTIE